MTALSSIVTNGNYLIDVGGNELSVVGNIAGGYFIGNGSQLTGVAGVGTQGIQGTTGTQGVI